MAKSPITNVQFKDAIEKRVNPSGGGEKLKFVEGVPGRSGSGVAERLYDDLQPRIPKGKDISKTNFHWDLKKGS